MSSNPQPELEDFTVEINTAVTSLKHPSLSTSTIPTLDLAQAYFQKQSQGSGILPPVVRGISSDFTWVMVERPPTEVKIHYTTNYGENADDEYESEELQYSIQLPWMIYVIKFADTTYTKLRKLHLYARPAPIVTGEDILYILPVPNVFHNGEACVNNTIKFGLESLQEKDASLHSAVHCVINSFWDSNFNMDAQSLDKSTVPDKFKTWTDEADGSMSWSDRMHTCILEHLANTSSEEILNVEYKITEKMPEYISEGHYSGIMDLNPMPKVLTVDLWLRYFDAISKKNNYDKMINPVLGFFKDLMK